MNPIITPDIREVMEAVHYRPSVSLIMPFDTRVNMHKETSHALKVAADKVETELLNNYPAEMAKLVIHKLRAIIKSLATDIHGKSVAIFVSPVFEKVFFLDFVVEEKIIVDESFEIRDLVFGKKQLNNFLVMLLSGHESRLLLWNAENFIRIATEAPETIDAYVNEAPERVANFSDISDRKEIMTDKFLQQMDHSLSQVLKTYQLPVLIIGTERILGHFKQLTKNDKTIAAYIPGNYESATLPELKELINPYIRQWQRDKEMSLLKEIDRAAGQQKLAAGIMDVWRDTIDHKGRLLIVEKDFMYPAQRGSDENLIYDIEPPYNRFSYIKDAVDDIMEKILTNGGDVEFVDHGVLKDYNHIALIRFY